MKRAEDWHALAFAQRALVRMYDVSLSVCALDRTSAVLVRLRDRHASMWAELERWVDGARARTGLLPDERLWTPRAVDDLGALLTVAKGEGVLLRHCEAALAGELPDAADAAVVKLRALVHSNLRCLSRALVERTWASDRFVIGDRRNGAA